MSELKALAQHRWADIYDYFGVDKQFLTGKHTRCPLCSEGKDRFRYTDKDGYGGYICNQCGHGDGFDFLARYTGQDLSEVIKDVKSMLGVTMARPRPKSDMSKVKAKRQREWDEANKLTKGCPTHRYLLSRGLAGLEFGRLRHLRCHPGLTYWHVEDDNIMDLGKHPAMLALITTPAGEPATLHATYLTADGRKAALDPVRKIFEPFRDFGGGAVRLGMPQGDQVLCVAEGIETALSMKLLFPEIVPWACVNAGNMQKFEAPNDSATMYIAADNDISYTGQAAAYALAKRLSQTVDISVKVPPKAGTDWNDYLVAKNGRLREAS